MISSAPNSLQRGGIKVGETQVELQTRAVKELEQLLRRKTEQIKLLSPSSNGSEFFVHAIE